MNITFYGHNCFVLKGKNVVVVSDPWLTKKGAFFGSWFQWPINHHLIDKLKSDLTNNNKTILYISHEHQDHFDKETLNDIKDYIDVCVIPNYQDKFLNKELVDLGYKVMELNDQNKYFISKKDYIELLIVDTGVNHDSAALIHIDDQNFVNQNDCKIFDRLTYFKDINVDYYAVQFSGATWYPLCYELKKDEIKHISRKKTAAKFIAIRNAIKTINPKYYLPSAGPAIFPFLDDNLSLGSGNIFTHQPELHQKLKSLNTQLIYLKPGGQFENLKSTKPIEPPSAFDLDEVKDKCHCIFETIKDDEFIPEKLLEEVNSRLSEIKDVKFGYCPKILFDWGDEYMEIDLVKCRAIIIDVSTYTLPDSYLRLTASRAYFSLMSNPAYRWQDIALSFRVSIERKPNMMNTFINIFLFSDTTNIRSGFTTTLDIKEQRIVIINPLDGKNFEIDRYCPHNGADLKNAKIDTQGNLVCPRHAWLFDLEDNGNCRTATASLNAKEVIKTISLCDTISARLLKLDK